MNSYRSSLTGSLFKLIVPIFILFSPIVGAAETDVEKDLQDGLELSSSLTSTIQDKLKSGSSITDEIKKLKSIAEEIKASHMLLEERFNRREEKLKGTVPDLRTERSGVVESGLSQSKKALERHQAMKEGYQTALREYLGLIEALSGQESEVRNQKEIIEKLRTLLDKIVVKKKRPILGSLPYKNLNYPSREPNSATAIIPAYLGGNKIVSPDDLKSTEDAPISAEISELAQSLNWQPVAIYEYVKNNIETEWYYGCMKGAEETLHQKAGNDCDQASLLTALLRASGFPTRYVRGTIQFFATDGKAIERIKNLTGVQEPYKIAEFFQKTGIPFKPVIQGGGIANIQIEHVWVESQIPYANYRGAVIDEHGKTWLGLDTSIKVKDYQYNSPEDIFELPAVTDQLSGLRDEYLMSPLLQGEGGVPTPLEYLEGKLSSLGYQPSDFKRTRTLPEEHLKILPSSMQIEPVKITNEYTAIPEELKHKVKITAADTNKYELFTITLPTQKLSNQRVALSYEPETVEDQEIIDSYGGLDNTPSYLVRLRPVLKMNGERIVVAQDGLPMGSDYNLSIELISPNGAEQVTSSHIVGNLSVIGIVAGKASAPSLPLFTKEGDGGSSAESAEEILYKEAMRYISRWNQAEEELASLLHLAITRPVPTVVTVGGVIDVTYLLDMPHGFEWKGVFMDAGLRRIETVEGTVPGFTGVSGASAVESGLSPKKLFLQLSALQGSVLENRIFEDDFKVESISTAKLFQLSNSTNTQLVAIDKTNIKNILPTLNLDEAIKEDIVNSVNQNLTVRIPQSELTYKNWTGTGYIKENPSTGEAGYMLSGMIAGGMTAVDKLQWYMQDIANLLSAPYTYAPNTNPAAAVKIVRINATDYQSGKVDKTLSQPLQVMAVDSSGRAVKGVPITFSAIAGGGSLTGLDAAGNIIFGHQISIETKWNGVATAYLKLGKVTSDSPYYAYGDPYYMLVGHNLVSASAMTGSGTIYTNKPFEAYGYPGDAVKIIETYGSSDEANNKYFYGLPNTLSSTIVLKVADEYGNPISNKKVKFTVEPQTFQYFTTSVPAPTGTIKNAKIFKKLSDCPGIATLDCPNALSELSDIYTDSSGALAYLILGNTDNTKYTVHANAKKDQDGIETNIDITPPGTFNHYISSVKTSDRMATPQLSLVSLAVEKNAAPPGTEITEPLTAVMRVIKEEYNNDNNNHAEYDAQQGLYYIKGKGTFTTTPVNNGEVTFSVINGGGTVNPTTVKYPDTSIIDGKYKTYLTLGSNPDQNIVNAKGKATISTPMANQSTGLIDYTDNDLNSSTSFEITGIKATVNQNQIIIINNGGYPMSDTIIKYKIEPAGYKPQDLFIDIYEDDRWFGFLQADTNGNITLSQGGAKFDETKKYKAELILNRGSKIEIRSEKNEMLIVPAPTIAMDGDNDGTIDPDNKADKSYLFWVNDDHDDISNNIYDSEGNLIAAGNEEDDINDNRRDSEDNVIKVLRDLEDFARVHIAVDSRITHLPGITYHLKMQKIKDDIPTPEINLFRAVKPDFEYLTKIDVANDQILETRVNYAPIGGQEVQLNSNYFIASLSPFIFEGKTAGKGKLTFIVKQNGAILSESSVFLELRSIKEFYEKYKVDLIDESLNTVFQTATSNLNNTTYMPERNDYILFVHGYNVTEWEKEKYADTMFKRLWWHGYKGRVGMFSWPTSTTIDFGEFPIDGLLKFDISEQRGWNSAPALSKILAALNEKYRGLIRVIAHSHGNVPVGEAMKRLPSQTVNAYIATQAAISANMYDPNAASPDSLFPDWFTKITTPNIYSYYYSGKIGSTSYMADNRDKTNIISFYNELDFALKGWWPNNVLKPDGYYGYAYRGSRDEYSPTRPENPDKFYQMVNCIPDNSSFQCERKLNLPEDRYEIFARCAESRSGALGATSLAVGLIKNQVNLEDPAFGYDGKHYSHSREFRSNIINECTYWTAVLNNLGISVNITCQNQ